MLKALHEANESVSLERIEVTPFAVIAGEILQNRKTGLLSIIRPPVRKTLYWSQGELVMTVSSRPEDTLAEFAVRRGHLTAEQASALRSVDGIEVVDKLHESGLMDLSARQTLLREWLTAQFIPLFSLEEGTAVFTDDDPLPPEKRVFLQSTAAIVVDGIRTITNGLVLRRSLGDLKREIEIARDSRFHVDALPLTEEERQMARSLSEPTTIETFLKRFASQSVIVSRVVISMLVLGVYTVVQQRAAAATAMDLADMQRDLELLAAIGSSDPRSLRTVALSRQLPTLDHYQVLDVPRAASRAQILAAADQRKKAFDPATYPPIVRDSIDMIHRRIEEALLVLQDPQRRGNYDKLILGRTGEGAASLQQRLTQRSIAEQNHARAKTLASEGDYYGAIVLLKQAVEYLPDFAEAWQLLGACQERNPKWRREAAESLQVALSIDPNNVEAMISLGDLYKSEGMISRAQTCYEDVLKIAPDNPQAKSRLQGLKR